MTEAGYKRVFFLGALWNLLGGAAIAAASGWIFQSAGAARPFPPAYYDTWVAMILAFGLGYFLIYRDMFRNRDIVLMGAVAKSAFAVIFVYNYLVYPGQVPIFFLVPIAGDLVFVVFFVMFLRFALRNKRR